MWPQMTDAFTIRRYAAQTFDAHGYPVAQTPTEIPATGSVQPADDRVIITDPGYKGEERRRFFIFAEVLTANETTGVPSDEVEWSGGVWRVFSVDPWQGLGPIAAHWEAEVWLVQPIVPVTP